MCMLYFILISNCSDAQAQAEIECNAYYFEKNIAYFRVKTNKNFGKVIL